MTADLLATVGQFGLAAGITIYLIWWITSKLSEQLDRNTDVIAGNTEILRELKELLKK